MTLQDLIGMPLHSRTRVDTGDGGPLLGVLRVPGGWVYSFFSDDTEEMHSGFIPEPLPNVILNRVDETLLNISYELQNIRQNMR